jgi:hypothetical protein
MRFHIDVKFHSHTTLLLIFIHLIQLDNQTNYICPCHTHRRRRHHGRAPAHRNRVVADPHPLHIPPRPHPLVRPRFLETLVRAESNAN